MNYKIPNQNKQGDVQRRSMPQINTKEFLKDKDFKTSLVDVKTKDLILLQKHFNDEKVDGMIKSGKDFDGVIVSSDNVVIDGNHRVLAMHNTKGKMSVIKVDGTAEEIIEKLKDKPYVEKKKLMESKTITFDAFMEATKESKKKKKVKPANEIITEPTMDDTLTYGSDETVNDKK